MPRQAPTGGGTEPAFSRACRHPLTNSWHLSSLRFLNLSSNGFSGSIPASLGRLHRLHTLDLSDNAFSGEIPVNLSSCTSLMVMDISFNQLHGHVPSEIGNKLTSFSILSIRRNNLIGAILESLANLSSLTILDLSH